MAFAMVKVLGVCRLPIARSRSAWTSWRNEEVEAVGLPLPDLSRINVGDRGELLDQVPKTAKASDFVLAEEHDWLP